MTMVGTWLFGAVAGWAAMLILRPALAAGFRWRSAVPVLGLLAGSLVIACCYTGSSGVVEAAFGLMSGALGASALRVGARPRS